MSKTSGKQYGLILPHTASGVKRPLTKPSIFDEDSDSDESHKKPCGISRELKRQELLAQSKAVEEDPTIFQYDELYDEMQEKRNESTQTRKDQAKQPKYINKLLVTAEKRKLENDRRIERQTQREREAEGDLYKDKESFITASYKKKLEEIKALDELEKREEYLEAIGDVTRQANLDGFYRHLYQQQLNNDKEKEAHSEEKIKTQVTSAAGTSSTFKGKAKHFKTRQYRQNQAESDSESSTEEKLKAQAHLACHLDADSDFSIDSDSDTDQDQVKSKSETESSNNKQEIESDNQPNPDKTLPEIKSDCEGKENKENVVEKQIIDIWKKRTVGAVFDAALARYLERKSLRERLNNDD